MDLKERYTKEIVPKIMKEHNLTTPMQVPKLKKIVINMGVGEAAENKKFLDGAMNDLALLSGQKPISIKAKKSVAAFKLREGNEIGCKVTLRGKKMYDFLDKLIKVNLPRVRDFKGLNPKSFDGHGNYSLGLTEQLIFTEIDYDSIVKVRGMDIVIVTTAKNDEKGLALLKELGLPFRK